MKVLEKIKGMFRKKTPQTMKPKELYNYYKTLNPSSYPEELKRLYKLYTNQELNLNSPQSFNEKIQWLKLYDSTPIKTKLADKYLVREWIAEKIGEEYLIPLIGAYDKFSEIKFSELPNQFVIKCNHGSGWNIVVKDKNKLNPKEAAKKINKWMGLNFAFHAGFELQYKNMHPKIIIEEFQTNNGEALHDYKFWCFNGEVKYMQYCTDCCSETDFKMAFYDKEWNKQAFYYNHPLYEKELKCPPNYQKMIEIAKKLCQGFSFVCVDLYLLNNGDIKFGEMTFTRSSGFAQWNDEKYNQLLGEMITLPEPSPIP